MGVTGLASVRAVVYGRVQGVFFRAYALRRAQELGLTGYVRNLHDSEAVEVLAEGRREKLEQLISDLYVGPPAASVERVEAHWSAYSGAYPGFSIRY